MSRKGPFLRSQHHHGSPPSCAELPCVSFMPIWLFLQTGCPFMDVFFTRALLFGVCIRALVFGNSRMVSPVGIFYKITQGSQDSPSSSSIFAFGSAHLGWRATSTINQQTCT